MQQKPGIDLTQGSRVDIRPLSARANPDPDLISLSDVFRALARNALILLLAVAVSVGLVWYYVNYVATPLYRSYTTILIETRKNQFVDLDSPTEDFAVNQSSLNSEVGILQSRELLGKVVDRLNLIEDTEFNYLAWTDPEDVPADEADLFRARGRDVAVSSVMNSIEVQNEPLTYIIEVSVVTSGAEQSAEIANAIAASYLDQQIELKSLSTQEGVEWLSTRVTELQQELRDAERQLEDSRFNATGDRLENRIVVDQLTNDVEATRELYQYFLSRLKEISVQDGLHRADARVLSQAITPFAPSSPKKKRLIAVGAVGGLFLGMFFVFWRESFNRGIRSTKEMEAVSGYPVIGELPKVGMLNRNHEIARLVNPRDRMHFEAVNDLRLSLPPPGKPGRVVAVCSAVPGEGKTSVALALTRGFAKSKDEVLLIDGDFRTSALTKTLQNDKRADATNEIDWTIKQSEPIGGGFLGVGHGVDSPIDFFATEEFGALMQSAREHYGLVVIDTPPLLAVSDAIAVAQAADTCLYVVNWNRTPRSKILQGIEMLERAGVTPHGIVLNRMNRKLLSRRSYRSHLRSLS